MAPSRTKPASGLLTRGERPTSLINSLLKSLPSQQTRRSYAKAIDDLYTFAAGRPITFPLLCDCRTDMAGKLRASSVNVRIAAIRRLIQEAHSSRLASSEEAWELLQLSGLPFRGQRVGNWLTERQMTQLLSVPIRSERRGKRNYCILAILGGCALRVQELAALDVASIQQRDGRWVIADLPGKGGRIRTVAIPGWVKTAIDAWLKESKIKEGRLVRQLTLKPEGMSTFGIRTIVRKTAKKIGVQKFGPHDLRRTCARLCRDKGGDLEQIQMMLGHASLVTTQRYLGTTQNFRQAVNDALQF
jgi:integrase